MKFDPTHILFKYLAKRFNNIDELQDNPVFLREAGIRYGIRKRKIQDYVQAFLCSLLIFPLLMPQLICCCLVVGIVIAFFYSLMCSAALYITGYDFVTRAREDWQAGELLELHLSGLSGHEILWGRIAGTLYRQANALTVIALIAMAGCLVVELTQGGIFAEIYSSIPWLNELSGTMNAALLAASIILTAPFLYIIALLMTSTIQMIFSVTRLSRLLDDPLYVYFLRANLWIALFYFAISAMNSILYIGSIFIMGITFRLMNFGTSNQDTLIPFLYLVALIMLFLLCWLIMMLGLLHSSHIVYKIFRNRSLIYYRFLIHHLIAEK